MADVTVQDVGPCKKHLRIVIPQADVQKKVEESYRQLQSTATLPGFRRGHVPRKLLERRFSEEVLEDVKESLLESVSSEAIREKGLKPIGQPSFDNVSFAPDKECVVEITVEVEPQFELPEYKGLQLRRQPISISEEEVQRGLESLRMRHARLELMPQETAVAPDDWIICDWRASSNGETVADQKDAELIVSGRRSGGIELEKDLGEALAGARFGETREIRGKFMETYPVDKWRGKECVLTITTKEIRRAKPPELNDEFAKSLDFENMDELRKAVESRIRQAKERQAQLNLEQQLFDQLLERCPFDLPQGVLKAQARNILLRQQYRLRQRGVPNEEIEKHLEELRNASEEAAARNLKIFFILDRIADKEKLYVTEAEVEQRIAEMAPSYGMSPQRMRAHIEQEGALAELRAGMREDKVVQFLIKNAKVSEATA